MGDILTCPNCGGLGRLEGDDYSVTCWFCNGSGVLHRKRLEECREKVRQGVEIMRQLEASRGTD